MKGTLVKLTTQLTAVIIVGLLGLVGLVLGLAVLANWSDGAIIGMATGIGAVLANTIIAVRGQQQQAATLANQDDKLETITQQTNGLSERERQDIAERAVQAALGIGPDEYRRMRRDQ